VFKLMWEKTDGLKHMLIGQLGSDGVTFKGGHEPLAFAERQRSSEYHGYWSDTDVTFQ